VKFLVNGQNLVRVAHPARKRPEVILDRAKNPIIGDAGGEPNIGGANAEGGLWRLFRRGRREGVNRTTEFRVGSLVAAREKKGP